MAIKKQINLPSGYVAEYLRVAKVSQDKKYVLLSVDLYKDAAARQAGKSPVVKNYLQKQVTPSLSGGGGYTFELTDDEFEAGNIYEVAYTYLKSLPCFEGAQDV